MVFRNREPPASDATQATLLVFPSTSTRAQPIAPQLCTLIVFPLLHCRFLSQPFHPLAFVRIPIMARRIAYGAIGKHGSLAVVERLILTMKTLLSRLLLVPYRHDAFLRELGSTVAWYNEHRAHTWLGGRTPNEVYFGRFPANRKPRIEPRSRWLRGSPCARPWALVRGSPGARLLLEISFHDGKRHLPVVRLKRAA